MLNESTVEAFPFPLAAAGLPVTSESFKYPLKLVVSYFKTKAYQVPTVRVWVADIVVEATPYLSLEKFIVLAPATSLYRSKYDTSAPPLSFCLSIVCHASDGAVRS